MANLCKQFKQIENNLGLIGEDFVLERLLVGDMLFVQLQVIQLLYKYPKDF